MIEQHPFDPERLGAFSQRFADALFEAFPHLRQFATMFGSSEPDGLSLNVMAPSPTGDKDRFIQVWVDEEVTPTVGFGPMHTHRSPDEAGIAQIIDLCRAVLADQLLIVRDVGDVGDGVANVGWVDLRDPDALLEEITAPYTLGDVRLESWSGSADRIVGAKDL